MKKILSIVVLLCMISWCKAQNTLIALIKNSDSKEVLAGVYFNPKTTMSLGVNTIFEDRTGGDILYIKGKGDDTHGYFEENKSSRFSTQFSLDHHFNEKSGLSVKNSINSFNRTISIPAYIFDGKQLPSYSEVTYYTNQEKTD